MRRGLRGAVVMMAVMAVTLLLNGCYSRSQRLYQRAEAFLARGDSVLAAEEYRRLVHEEPRSPLADDALYKLGYLFREDFRDSAGAIMIYRLLAEEYGESPYAALSLLWVAYIQRRDLADPDGVRATHEALLSRFPEDTRTIARCHLEVVRALYASGKYVEAGAEAELLQRVYPHQPWQASAAGLIEAKAAEKQLGDRERIVEIYERIVDQYPGTYSGEEAKRAIGRIYYGQRAEDQQREQEQLRRAARVIHGVPAFSGTGTQRRQQLAALNSLLAHHGARQQDHALLALSGAAFDLLYKPEDPTVAGRLFVRNPFVLVADNLGFTVNQWSASTAEGSFGALVQALQGGRPVLIQQTRPSRWVIVTGYRPAEDQVLLLAAGRERSNATNRGEFLRRWSDSTQGMGSYYQFSIVERKHTPSAGEMLRDVISTAIGAIQGGQVSGVASGLDAYRALEQELARQPSDDVGRLLLWAEQQLPELKQCRKAARVYLRQQAEAVSHSKKENLVAAADVYHGMEGELDTLAGAIRRAGEADDEAAAEAWERAARQVNFISDLERQALTLLQEAAAQ